MQVFISIFYAKLDHQYFVAVFRYSQWSYGYLDSPLYSHTFFISIVKSSNGFFSTIKFFVPPSRLVSLIKFSMHFIMTWMFWLFYFIKHMLNGLFARMPHLVLSNGFTEFVRISNKISQVKRNTHWTKYGPAVCCRSSLNKSYLYVKI